MFDDQKMNQIKVDTGLGNVYLDGYKLFSYAISQKLKI